MHFIDIIVYFIGILFVFLNLNILLYPAFLSKDNPKS